MVNRAETASVLSVLRAAYPRFYADMSKDELVKIVDLWADMFATDSVVAVASAVKSLIASDASGFPPNIGKVTEALRKQAPQKHSAAEDAWRRIEASARSGAADNLPPSLRWAADTIAIETQPNRLALEGRT